MTIRIVAKKGERVVWDKVYMDRAEARQVADRLIEQGYANYVDVTYLIDSDSWREPAKRDQGRDIPKAISGSKIRYAGHNNPQTATYPTLSALNTGKYGKKTPSAMRAFSKMGLPQGQDDKASSLITMPKRKMPNQGLITAHELGHHALANQVGFDAYSKMSVPQSERGAWAGAF
jgi:hypothetical protein